MMLKLVLLIVVAVVLATSVVVDGVPFAAPTPEPWYYCGKDPLQPVPVIPSPSSRKTAQIIQVSTVIRHGDRSTFGWYPRPGSFGSKLMCWPNDTNHWDCRVNYDTVPGIDRTSKTRVTPTRLFRKLYDNDENVLAGNCDVGQLTKKGYLQQITNGQMIRNYYVDKVGLLPQNLTADNLYKFFVRSDDEPRTVLSAQSLFLGLFPFNETEANETIVVNIHSRSDSVNIMTVNPRLCPRIAQLQEEARKTNEYTNFVDSIVEPLMLKLSRALGTEVKSAGNFEDLSDCSNAYYCHGFPLHPGINISVIKQMEMVDVWIENFMNSYPSIVDNSRLGIGFLIREIYSHINNRVNNTRYNETFLLYSGHDTTILPLLMAYNLPPKQWVPYASTLIFELYSVTSGQTGTPYAVRMLYNQEEQLIPGCDDVLCAWDDFSRISENLYTHDYEGDCAPRSKF